MGMRLFNYKLHGMEKEIAKHFDLNSFWKEDGYALREYMEDCLDDKFASIEQELGYKLPASYIELMRTQNGGFPKNNCYPVTEPTCWAENHIALQEFFAIGRSKKYSLCGAFGNRFRIDTWKYPDDGVYICDCPSGRHDIILLDYTNNGNDGEPEVVHVDQEDDFKKTFFAKDFDTFIRGLVHGKVYNTSEQDLADALKAIHNGWFSNTLQGYFQKDKSVYFERVLRCLFTNLTKAKSYFTLHGDPLSHLAYDIQFYLLIANHKITSWKESIDRYPQMVAFGNNEITPHGYTKGFVEGWFNERLRTGAITKRLWSGYRKHTVKNGYSR